MAIQMFIFRKKHSIPKIFHSIWMGGEFPQDYFMSLIEKVKICNHNNYKFIMWVDDSSYENNHMKFSTINGLSIHNLSELEKDMRETYGDSIFNIFKKEIVDFELSIQPKGYAALSDFYRVEVLRQYGGIYLDTDIKMKLMDKNLPPDFKINFSPTGVFGRIPENHGANCIMIASDDFNAKNEAKNGFINMIRFNHKILFNNGNYENITHQQIDLLIEKHLSLCSVSYGLRNVGATFTIQEGVMCFYNSKYDVLYGETFNDQANPETRKFYKEILKEIKNDLIDIKEKTKFAYDSESNSFDESVIADHYNKYKLILDGSNVGFEVNYDNSWLIYITSATQNVYTNIGKIKVMDVCEYNTKRKSLYCSIVQKLKNLALEQI